MVDSVFATQVNSALRSNPHIAGRTLHFEASQGKVVLRGTVASYYQKQMAQEMLRGVEGVERIENELQVAWQ
jgi:osmotically-inducible protein OsmY